MTSAWSIMGVRRQVIVFAARTGSAMVIMALGSAAASASAQPVLADLGVLPGFAVARANAVSDDGSVVVGTCQPTDSDGPSAAFVWTSDFGMQAIGSLPYCPETVGLCVNSDGSVVGGYAKCDAASFGRSEVGFRWSADSGIEMIIVPGSFSLSTRVRGMGNLSGDFAGQYTNPFALPMAFYVKDSALFLALSLPGFGSARATAMSGDGQWVAGTCFSDTVNEAVRWNAGAGDTTAHRLGMLEGFTICEATAINDDGTVIVGLCSSVFPSPRRRSFIWSPTHQMRALGSLPAFSRDLGPLAVSGDGSTVGGAMLVGFQQRAFLYRSELGLVDFAACLEGRGVNLEGRNLIDITGISSDGSVIVGNSGGVEGEVGGAWIVTNFGIGPVCNDIDINNDGSLFDPMDIEAYLSVYSEGSCVPELSQCDDIDFNNDGSVFDPCDIAAFLLVFAEGPCGWCGG